MKKDSLQKSPYGKYGNMYSLSHYISVVKRNWKDFYWWKRRAIPRPFLSLYYGKIKGNKGTYIMEEDWDNLIILDACRYDVFCDVIGMNVDSKISRGSDTGEFLKENFSGRKFNNTIMVTSNPAVNLWAGDSFHCLISVWRHGWDNRLNTVLPQTVVEWGINAEKKYPNKRLIVWFMQPHDPFIRDQMFTFYDYKKIYEEKIEPGKGTSAKDFRGIYWVRADEGVIDINKVWAAYRRNVEAVIPHAFELARKLKGKTVITSDHGEAFKRLFFFIKVVAHTRGVYISDLIKVPWLVFNSEQRKEIKTASEAERIKKKVRTLRNSIRFL